MIRTFEKRLQALEKTAKEENEIQGIWIDMFDREVKETVTENEHHQTHSKLNFPSVVNAGQYVENLLNDSGPNVGAVIFISDLREFFMVAYESSDFAKTFSYLLPDEEISVYFGIPWNRGKNPVNFQSCTLYAACRAYFSTIEFYKRYQKQEFTEKDHRYFNAMYLVYCLIYPDENFDEFCKIVIHAGHLNRVSTQGLN